MIPRRAAGALVLVVGLTLALVLPAALGRRIAGSAGRPPVPAPPAVGDCLTAPPTPAGSPIDGRIAVAAAPADGCSDGVRFGEIVSVDNRPATVPAGVAVSLPVPDPNACGSPLRSYLGWTSQPWNPVALDAVILLGPDAEQVAVGQTWIACAITTGRDGYRGSVRDGFGPAADRYGRCQPTLRFDPAPTPCDRPHAVEMLGTAVVGFDDLAGLDASCADLVRQRTGLTDPTAGGRLAVRVAPVDPNTVPPDVSAGGQAMTCGVQVDGGGMLTAALTGIGDRPLPQN